ncbi:DegT/DnrJ/EryC1/StrS aminotransferase family protein [Thioalkalivibrio sp. ALM2T]|uniref:DegT/DnrJ/EryC1/StrS family aminotransferase n=1 Tax=Thioalkalivibrio sp. ALM2T TaxID=1158184 RepID=UPI0012DC62CD|nr:DegT/DnrJ/EryC1/StrS family aminotransferase [Thioalkalivibrio sp. ALM2T]
MKTTIPLTQPCMPDREKLDAYLDGIYERKWLTNNGPLVQELTRRLEDYLGVENILLVANGTLALQVAYAALGISQEAVTSPFTFAATPGSLARQGITPRFADIDESTFNLDPNAVEESLTDRTQAIVPVHVYGNPCEDEALQKVAIEHGLKLVYDAAHAFGITYRGESVLKCGDAATLSFHATKLFHTVEGGAMVFRRKEDLERARSLINFGLGDGHFGGLQEPGINAKMSEVHAAFGLAQLDIIDDIIEHRVQITEHYRQLLGGYVTFQQRAGSENGAYMPIVLPTEIEVETVEKELSTEGIHTRRYFSPALHETEAYGTEEECPVASDISRRVLCLPIHAGLSYQQVERVSQRLIQAIE